METVLLVIMMLGCFSFALKQSFNRPLIAWLIFMTVLLFAGLSWGYAIEQSETVIKDWLGNQALMLDVAVVLSVEVVFQLFLSLILLRKFTGGLHRRWERICYVCAICFPGFLIYLILFAAVVGSIFRFPGVSFPLIAWGVGGLAVFVLALLTVFLRKFFPEPELRAELLFLSNILLALLGVIATVNGRVTVVGESKVDVWALLFVILLVSGGMLAGLLSHYYRCRKY